MAQKLCFEMLVVALIVAYLVVTLLWELWKAMCLILGACSSKKAPSTDLFFSVVAAPHCPRERRVSCFFLGALNTLHTFLSMSTSAIIVVEMGN